MLTRHEVTDIPAAFVADPFIVRDGAQWLMFIEVKNAETRHGEIALARSSDGVAWRYDGVVLRERLAPQETAEGIYSVSFNPPPPGVY